MTNPSGAYDPAQAAQDAATAAAQTTANDTPLRQFPDGTVDLYGLGNIGEQGVFTGTAPGQGGWWGADMPGQHSVFTPAYKVMQTYAQMSATDPNSFAAVQSSLYQAGDYGSTKPNWGVWTQKDGAAFTSALRGYLGIIQTLDGKAPMTFAEWLAKSAATGAANAAAAPGTPISITDTTTLEGDANASGQKLLGRDLSSGEASDFAANFQQEEINGQEAKAGAKGADGETIVQMPSRYDAPTAAEQMIKSKNTPEYHQALQASYGDVINQLLGVK